MTITCTGDLGMLRGDYIHPQRWRPARTFDGATWRALSPRRTPPRMVRGPHSVAARRFAL